MTTAEKWEAMPEVMSLKDFMQVTGMSRRAATHIVNMKSFPLFPRMGAKKQGQMRMPKTAAQEWMENFQRGTK